MTKSSNGCENALHASHAEERRELEKAIRRLEAECKRLDDRTSDKSSFSTARQT